MRVFTFCILLLLVFLISSANAQNPRIALFTDETVSDCDSFYVGAYDPTFIPIFYIRCNGPNMGNAYEFKLDINLTLSDFLLIEGSALVLPPGADASGNLLDGISITVPNCLGGQNEEVVWLGTFGVMFFEYQADVYITVVDHPSAVPSPGIYITECVPDEWPKHEVLGGYFKINSTCIPDTCGSYIVEVIAQPPDVTLLNQNFPNPFNPTTRIRFSIREPANTKLSIYDTMGRLVRVIVDERLDAGHYEEVWDGKCDSGRQATSGIYFYRLVSGRFENTRKMTLLR